MLFYQSVYALQQNFDLEASVKGKIVNPAGWQAGVRISFNPAYPEVFGRILLMQEIGVWSPDIGIEMGITSVQLAGGTGLLSETRKAMLKETGICYLAIHAAPLQFRINEHWRISSLEIDIGTHFRHFGRTLRGQVMLLSVTRKF